MKTKLILLLVVCASVVGACRRHEAHQPMKLGAESAPARIAR